MRTCDYVFIGLAVLFLGVLGWKLMKNKEPFTQVSCGCSGRPEPQPYNSYSQNEIASRKVKLENAYNDIWSNPDNKYPFMVGAGATPDGHRRHTPDQQKDYNDSIKMPCANNEFMSMVENMAEDASPKNSTPNTNIYVGDSCLPPSMCADGCNDPTFEVYDRKIGQVSKSRNYNQGDKIRGDLFICPSRPTDAYGHDWFRPSNTNGVLNAGALRFIAAGGNNGFTNIQGDDIFNHGGKSANIDAQYAQPSC